MFYNTIPDLPDHYCYCQVELKDGTQDIWLYEDTFECSQKWLEEVVCWIEI